MPSLAFLRRWLPSPIIEAAERDIDLEVEHKEETVNLNLLHISLSLLHSLTICAVSYLLAGWLGVSRFFKLDLAEVIIASNACAGGPTTAAALAASKGWRSLVTPAVMCGVFGYVVANFVGVFLGGWLA